tara:strand:+ start:206 stop:322 length:117 start_codon:yes stop_codon:yes gene_type:complete
METPYDGFIGLLPHQGTNTDPDAINFLKQLADTGKITD